MAEYLTTEQVLAIHDQMVKRFGGSLGLREVGLLESAVARPQASFGGENLYPGLFEKAASLFHSLLKNHPFVDGNKRTALTSAGIFLWMNGYSLVNRHEEEARFALEVENESLGLGEIGEWLRGNSVLHE